MNPGQRCLTPFQITSLGSDKYSQEKLHKFLIRTFSKDLGRVLAICAVTVILLSVLELDVVKKVLWIIILDVYT